MIAKTRLGTLVVNARLDLMVSKLGRRASHLINRTQTPRVPLARVAAVVANVAAVVAVSRRASSHIRVKARASLVMLTLSGRRVRRDRAAVTGKVARTSNATRLAVIAAGTGRFSE